MNRERIRNTGTNREHPLQWKMTPHQWKCGALKKLRVTPTSGNIELDPTSGNIELDPTSGNM